MTDISNMDDVIDSRDVIKRIEELQSERDSLKEEHDSARAAFAEKAGYSYDDATAEQIEDDDTGELLSLESSILDKQSELIAWEVANADELKALESLQEGAEGYAEDWRHGATLIRESYFTDYAEELLKDIGDLPQNIPHYIVIDWEKTADNIREDYTSVDFDGVTYWVR